MIYPVTIPTRTFFGNGVRTRLDELLPLKKGDVVLLVATASSLARKDVAAVHEALATRVPVHLWTSVQPNPRFSDIDACTRTFCESGITHVLGIGGGSALDQAKATAMAMETGLSVTELFRMNGALPERRNTLVLIPTTSGTGAELSYAAILTDSEARKKQGLRGRALAPEYAFVDPELTWSVPEHISMVTGFDVFAHAMETLVSVKASPFTESLCRGALERIFSYLPLIRQEPDNATARYELSYASMTMGVTLALASSALPHRLQYPIGSLTDTAHAEGLAALYPAWLQHLRPFAEAKLAQCAAWTGCALPGATDTANALRFEEATIELMEATGLRISLRSLLQQGGVADMSARELAAMLTGPFDNDPSYRDMDDVIGIYEQALAYGAPAV